MSSENRRSTELDLLGDPIGLTSALVDLPSVSGDEAVLADSLEAALSARAPHLRVLRDGNVVLARTTGNGRSRVLLAGHLDTVPIADNVPSRLDGSRLYGCGASDMKSGVAMIAHLAATVRNPAHEITVILYDCEETARLPNGLGRIERAHPDWLRADLAILAEPTDGVVEAGCQGSLGVRLSTHGHRAHSARPWVGSNAIHAIGGVLERLDRYRARQVEIDGCVYREGLQAVRIAGGVADNVVPDQCDVGVNYRFAPDRDVDSATQHVQELFSDIPGLSFNVVVASPGALPGLSAPSVREFLAATGVPVIAKYGWTDVARFAAMGIPAINFGPGDPNLAHIREEHVEVGQISRCTEILRRYLGGAP